MQSKITLFAENEHCCGCGACMNICPKKAITMHEDEYGFLYPQIDENVCIKCGVCQSVCSFQNKKETHEPVATFAISAKDQKIHINSASGGAFAVLAEKIITEDGVVFGAAFDKDWNVCHIAINDIQDIKKLQGSKYVQSNIDKAYQIVKAYLAQGKKVLFSGTPCQVAGLYGYLGKDDESLVTVDLICHGVPNQRMFKDYLSSFGEVESFTFRDKSLGWGINGTIRIKGRKNFHKLWQSAEPYLYYFTKGLIYRDSCYKCKYACQHRPADITLGDYWGIEKQHPEYLGKNGFTPKMGISVAIANTEKGFIALHECSEQIDAKESTFSKATASNAQLVKPSEKKEKRQEILNLYAKDGWSAVAERFEQNIGIRKHSSFIKSMIPDSLVRFLKSKR